MLHIDATLIVQIVSFLVFLAILRAVFYRPVAAVLRERASRVEAGLRAAEESQRRAEQTQREVQLLLDEARVGAQSIIAAATKAAAEYRQGVMTQARNEAEALTRQARAEIQRERQAAMEALRREIGALAILTAGKVVGSSLDTAANRDVADRAIAEASGVR